MLFILYEAAFRYYAITPPTRHFAMLLFSLIICRCAACCFRRFTPLLLLLPSRVIFFATAAISAAVADAADAAD